MWWKKIEISAWNHSRLCRYYFCQRRRSQSIHRQNPWSPDRHCSPVRYCNCKNWAISDGSWLKAVKTDEVIPSRRYSRGFHRRRRYVCSRLLIWTGPGLCPEYLRHDWFRWFLAGWYRWLVQTCLKNLEWNLCRNWWHSENGNKS